MIKPERLKTEDIIGIIAPSRPIIGKEDEFDIGINILKSKGFKIKLGKNLHKKTYYSAGTVKERVSDLNEMFKDKKVRAIICATGGASSNQLLDFIDYEAIRENPKIFLGYSDITTLLLAIFKKTGMICFHGPDLCSLKYLNEEAKDFLFDILMGNKSEYCLPFGQSILKKGKAKGKLLGGNIHLSNALLGTKYSPSYKNAIWFWEELRESPASIDQKLHQFKLSGNLEKISAMVIGNLSDCIDKKYEEDNRSIDEIILEITKEYDFPIIKVPYFGHHISRFYAFPIGSISEIDTEAKKFKITTSPVI